MSIKSESIKAIRGGERFLNDLSFPRALESKVITAEIFKGRFEVASVPALPPGYFCLFAKDIPGKNSMTCYRGDIPLLAENEIDYKDQPICVLAGEDKDVLSSLAEEIIINYYEEMPLFSLETEDPAARIESFSHVQGDVEAGLKASKKVIKGEYSVNFQEYQFLEPQGAVALWEKKLLTVYCPTKNPFHVRDNISLLLDIPPQRVCIIVPDSVQDPGEKETLPTVIASLAALITFHSEKPARVTLSNTIKQYPALVRYATGVTKQNAISAVDAGLFMDTGAFSLRSPNLFQRAVYCLSGAYHFDKIAVNAHSIRTNKMPYTRFINGGACEAFFAVELHISRVARACGIDPLTFRANNLFRSSTRSPKVHKQAATIIRLLDDAARASDFKRKYAACEALRKPLEKPFDFKLPARGIGVALTYFGFDLIDETESEERHSVKLVLEKDDTLRIMTSALEPGQGLKHLFTAIAVRVLEIDPEDVLIENLDTSKVPNSGPIYETHGVTIIGKLIEQACHILKRKKGKTKKPLTVTREDGPRPPRTEQAKQIFQSSDAPSFPWCVTVVEVEIDPATYRVTVKGIWVSIETGTVLNREIAQAHVEREIMSALEFVEYTPSHHQHKMRARRELPPLHINFIEVPYPQGPLGAKGIGELPSLGLAPAYIAAVSQAAGYDFTFLPLAPMQIEDVLEGG